MKNFTTNIKLKCAFCHSTQFETNEDTDVKKHKSLKCNNCGKINDLNAIQNVAKENGINIVKEKAKLMIEDELKSILKKFK